MALHMSLAEPKPGCLRIFAVRSHPTFRNIPLPSVCERHALHIESDLLKDHVIQVLETNLSYYLHILKVFTWNSAL